MTAKKADSDVCLNSSVSKYDSGWCLLVVLPAGPCGKNPEKCGEQKNCKASIH